MPCFLSVDPLAPAPAVVQALHRHLADGGVAAAPTDTIYGLLANALDPIAVRRVYALKGRAFSNPLPLVVRDREQVMTLARELPPAFDRLVAAFWPGPLTLIVTASPLLPPEVSAGTGTVGMRQPNLPLLAALLATTAWPLTATSANRSGAPECRTASAVAEQFPDEDELLILDGGLSPLAQASTIVDLAQVASGGEPRLLRSGAIAADALGPYL